MYMEYALSNDIFKVVRTCNYKASVLSSELRMCDI